MKKLLIALSMYFLLGFTVFVPTVSSQDSQETKIEMAEKMRSEGKIYVVVLIVVILFTGLIMYAINTDRKVTKLEKEIKSLKSDQDS